MEEIENAEITTAPTASDVPAAERPRNVVSRALHTLFFGLNITWPKLIIFAVIAGVVTGIIMMIPALEGTSIQNIGISPEAWLLMAMVICTNSKRPLEAAVKTLVFFLISQPLVYLTMWPVYQSFPWHYYRFWFFATLATFPLAFGVYAIRLQNFFSLAMVLVASVFAMALGLANLHGVVVNFPLGLLTLLFCAAQAVVYPCVLLTRPWMRNAGLTIALAFGVCFAAYTLLSGPKSSLGTEYEGAENCSLEVADEGIATVTADGDNLDIVAHDYGSTELTITEPDGTQHDYLITVSNEGFIYMKSLDNADA